MWSFRGANEKNKLLLINYKKSLQYSDVNENTIKAYQKDVYGFIVISNKIYTFVKYEYLPFTKSIHIMQQSENKGYWIACFTFIAHKIHLPVS